MLTSRHINDTAGTPTQDHVTFSKLGICKAWSSKKDEKEENDGGFVGDEGEQIEEHITSGDEGTAINNVSDSSLVVAGIVSHVLDDSDRLNLPYIHRRSECRSNCSSSNSNSSGISTTADTNSDTNYDKMLDGRVKFGGSESSAGSSRKCSEGEEESNMHLLSAAQHDEEMKLHLPELLRKREHSGSSRDSGYSSYFSSGVSAKVKACAPFMDSVASSGIDSDQIAALTNSIPRSGDSLTPLSENCSSHFDINQFSQFPNNIRSQSGPLPNMFADSAYISANNNATDNIGMDQLFNSMPKELSRPNGMMPVNGQKYSPKMPSLDEFCTGYSNSWFNTKNTFQENTAPPSHPEAVQQNFCSSNQNGFAASQMLSKLNISSNSSNNNFVNGYGANTPNYPTDVQLNLPADDKLSQLLPSDPTAKKNFLDNIQLLNQLSSIAPLDDIDSAIGNVSMPTINSDFSARPAQLPVVHPNNHLASNYGSYHGMAPKSSALVDASALTNDQILEIASALLNSCTSPLDISLSEVQVMLKRAALLDPYAKHWLIRNFGDQKFGIRGGQEPLVFKYLSLCNNDKQRNDNLIAPSQMFNRGNLKHDSDNMWNAGYEPNITNGGANNIELLRRLSLQTATPNSSRPDSRAPPFNNSHVLNNSSDNYKITSLANGGFMTSKNCANFEKLTVHSSKDLPNHIAQQLAVTQPHAHFNRFFNAGNHHPSSKPFAASDLNSTTHDSFLATNFDMSNKLSRAASDLMVQPQNVPQQRIPPELINSKLPELLAAYHKIAPEILGAKMHPSHHPIDARPLQPSFGAHPSAPAEYFRNNPPDLLQFHSSFLSYRQMGSLSPLVYSLMQRIEDCYDQFRQVERQRKKTEAELARSFPGRRVSSSNTISLPRLPHNPTRLDRLVLDHMREHARVITLVAKMERLRNTPLQPGIHKSLSSWHSTLAELTTLRHADVSHIFLPPHLFHPPPHHHFPPPIEKLRPFPSAATSPSGIPPLFPLPANLSVGEASPSGASGGTPPAPPSEEGGNAESLPGKADAKSSQETLAEEAPPEIVALCDCLCRVVQATRGARTALYCALTLTTLQHLSDSLSFDAKEDYNEGSHDDDNEDEEEDDEEDEEDQNDPNRKLVNALELLLASRNSDALAALPEDGKNTGKKTSEEKPVCSKVISAAESNKLAEKSSPKASAPTSVKSEGVVKNTPIKTSATMNSNPGRKYYNNNSFLFGRADFHPRRPFLHKSHGHGLSSLHVPKIAANGRPSKNY